MSVITYLVDHSERNLTVSSQSLSREQRENPLIPAPTAVTAVRCTPVASVILLQESFMSVSPALVSFSPFLWSIA